jgi:hypothetical protein
MNESDSVRFAVKGAEFSPNDTWHCHCGAGHAFGAYAAAHWRETLTHTCSCGTVRAFHTGRVENAVAPKEAK